MERGNDGMSKILVVIDMQNDFITGPLGTPEARAILPRVEEKVCRYKMDDVYFTMDTHGEDYLETMEGKKLPVKHCILQTKGWELAVSLGDEVSSTHKIKKGRFGTINLGGVLLMRNYESKISEIEMVGVCTDICVISNALILKAMLPDIPIIVDSRCCAGTTPERHEMALEVMRNCQIEVI